MCDPVSITTLAISAVSSVAAYSGQRQQARAQEAGIRANYRERDAAMQAQQFEQNQQATQQMSQRAVEALRQRGRLAAALADSGLGGSSQSRLFGDIDMQEATDLATLEANRASAIAQGERQRRANTSGTNAELASIRQPSLLGTGLQIAGAGLDSYTDYRNREMARGSSRS